MRIVRPMLIAATAAVAACAEQTTAPRAVTSGPSHLEFIVLDFGNHPPPPTDTNYVALGSDGSSSSLAGATFFINRTGNNAWITFNSAADGSLVASPNARLQFRNKGDVVGSGTLTYFASGGTVKIDLAQAALTKGVATINGACFEAVPSPDAVVTADRLDGAPCVSLPFTGATLTDKLGNVTPYSGSIVVGAPTVPPPIDLTHG